MQASNGDTDMKNKICGHGVGEWGVGEGGTNGENSMETYSSTHKIDSQWAFAV